MALETVESPEQAVFASLESTEEPVVGGSFPGLLPDVLRSVEFRRILGKEMGLDAIFDFRQPLAETFRLAPGALSTTR